MQIFSFQKAQIVHALKKKINCPASLKKMFWGDDSAFLTKDTLQ